MPYLKNSITSIVDLEFLMVLFKETFMHEQVNVTPRMFFFIELNRNANSRDYRAVVRLYGSLTGAPGSGRDGKVRLRMTQEASDRPGNMDLDATFEFVMDGADIYLKLKRPIDRDVSISFYHQGLCYML